MPQGPRGSGKTAVAATLALQSNFPFVKLVSPDKLVGMAEAQRVDALVKAFEDAYKSVPGLCLGALSLA